MALKSNLVGKLVTIFASLSLVFLSLFLVKTKSIKKIYAVDPPTIIVEWNFPNNPDDAVADNGGIPSNSGKTISAVGTGAPTFATSGASTYSAKATGWDNGSGNKYWQVEFETLGYQNLKLSSNQFGSNTGPRDFKVQVKTSGEWTDVAGANIEVNGTWNHGKLESISLPSECDDQAIVYLRWIMTSNDSVEGGVVGSSGVNRIDDIVITGDILSADADGDGIPDSSDNCPKVANANQADSDGDGIGDVCDTVDPTTPVCGDGQVDLGEECDDGNNIDNDGCDAACQTEPITIVATKVVCNTETDLPNWGNPGPTVGATTAQDFVSSHPNCRIVSDWDFQWAKAGAGSFGSFQTDTSSLGDSWTTFNSIATISGVLDLGGQIEAREVFPNDNYVPFTNDDNNNVSSEFYCTGGIPHYDNWEWISSPRSGQTYYCVGLNAFKPGTIKGMKFEDINGDGKYKQNEFGIGGWTIQLKQNGNLVASTQTIGNGDFEFDNVTVGEYKVCEVNLSGWKRTFPKNSDCQSVTVKANEVTSGVNFGNFHLGKIFGYKFKDINGSGIWDKSGTNPEPGVEGWKICLLNILKCTKTDANGYYEFDNIGPGTYLLTEEFRPGWKPTRPKFGIHIISSTSGMGLDKRGVNYDFGNYLLPLKPCNSCYLR